jgi:hypothetical protein
MSIIPATQEFEAEGLQIWGKTVSQHKTNRAGDGGQYCFPSICKALSSIPRIARKKVKTTKTAFNTDDNIESSKDSPLHWTLASLPWALCSPRPQPWPINPWADIISWFLTAHGYIPGMTPALLKLPAWENSRLLRESAEDQKNCHRPHLKLRQLCPSICRRTGAKPW